MNKKIERKPGMKGQMFIIGALIMVTVIVLISLVIDTRDILEKKNFLESGIENKEFDNLRNELIKSSYNAANDTNINDITTSFIQFSKTKLSGRTINLKGLHIGSKYQNLQSSQNTPLNVTVYNFFDKDVTNIILNLSTDFNSPTTFNNIQPNTAKSASFNLNLPSDQNLILWVSYDTSDENVIRSIEIPAEISSSKFVSYIDVRFSSQRGEIRERFSEVTKME